MKQLYPKGRTKNDLIRDAEAIHGAVFGYDYIDGNSRLPAKDFFFHVSCLNCDFVWLTTCDKLINKDGGCPWCKNRATTLRYYYLYTILQMSNRRFGEGSFQYPYNDENKRYISTDKINVWCGYEDHEIYQIGIGKHFSISKRFDPFKQCKSCLKENKKPGIKWKGNIEKFIERGEEIFGDLYDYSEIDESMLNDKYSEVPITCTR